MVRKKKKNGAREILESVATIVASGAAIVANVRPLIKKIRRKYRTNKVCRKQPKQQKQQ